jgi:DNA-binding MarR family transcriptional regulator
MPPKTSKALTEVTLHLERYVPGLLAWLSNKLAGDASKVYRSRFGVGIVEWRILSYLAVYEWGTGAQMSQLMGTDKAAISRGAAFLQGKKMIRSKQGFGRNLEFCLTPKGRELHDRIIKLALARERSPNWIEQERRRRVNRLSSYPAEEPSGGRSHQIHDIVMLLVVHVRLIRMHSRLCHRCITGIAEGRPTAINRQDCAGDVARIG